VVFPSTWIPPTVASDMWWQIRAGLTSEVRMNGVTSNGIFSVGHRPTGFDLSISNWSSTDRVGSPSEGSAGNDGRLTLRCGALA